MELDLASLKSIMRFKPSLSETASMFDVSEDTITRRIKEWEKITFTSFREKHSHGIRQRLIDRAIDMALSGNATMMIFCLKNYCGWADKPEDTQQKDTTIQIVISQDDLAL